MALAICVGFAGMLRLGEILRLEARDVCAEASASRATLTLRDTKSTKRRGEVAETIVITDAVAVQMLAVLTAQRMPSHTLFGLTSAAFRKKWKEAVAFFQLQGWHLLPHSLRRGGATFDFSGHGLIDRTIVRGRWQSHRTARLYIEEGLVHQGRLQLAVDQRRDLFVFAQFFHRRWYRQASLGCVERLRAIPH